MLAEHLVGGLTPGAAAPARRPGRGRPPDGRGRARSRTSTPPWSRDGIPHHQAFTITVRVFRSGGLTKDAVYLRGLLRARRPPGRRRRPRHAAGSGKMPLTAAPLVGDLHRRGRAARPAPAASLPRRPRRPSDRLARLAEVQLADRADRRGRMKIGFVVNARRHRAARVHDHPPRAGRHPTRARHLADGRGRLLPPARRLGGRPRRRGQGQEAQGRRRPTSRACRPTSRAEPICVDDLDVLVMRNDPADDAVERPWAVTSGILFGQLSVTRGTLVVNDPDSLANAVNKTYFQQFPEAVRPRTLISRDAGDIAELHRRHGRPGGAQAAAGLGRHRRVLRVERRVAQPQPDDRGGRPRRLRRRPGGAARGRRGRRAAVRDERRAARWPAATTPPSAG